MKIESYSFGQIRIDGKEHRSDLVLYPDRVDDKWWRQEGHLLQPEDLAGVFSRRPDILIVGQGLPGLMKVDAKVEERCREHKIELISLPTMEAVEKYNQLANKKPLVIAALHLTC
jgi:hypothetical protein